MTYLVLSHYILYVNQNCPWTGKHSRQTILCFRTRPKRWTVYDLLPLPPWGTKDMLIVKKRNWTFFFSYSLAVLTFKTVWFMWAKVSPDRTWKNFIVVFIFYFFLISLFSVQLDCFIILVERFTFNIIENESWVSVFLCTINKENRIFLFFYSLVCNSVALHLFYN